MALIEPFKGIRYNRAGVGGLEAVITPPYDVISPREQLLYYARSPFNIIRLEYGATHPGDNDSDNRYTRAAATLRQWLDGGILLPEKEKVFYLYRQAFTHRNSTYHRDGIITALKVEPYAKNSVLPHEETLAGPKSDRLELLRRCRSNFSPIFGLFPDPEHNFDRLCGAMRKARPLLELSEENGWSHTLWAVRNREGQRALAGFLEPLTVFIADGHHRYETALHYSQEMDPDLHPGCGYLLANLVSLHDPGLVILPTHRLLKKLSAGQEKMLPLIIEERFEIAEWGNPEKLQLDQYLEALELRGRGAPCLGLILPGRACLLSLNTGCAAENLDVIILQEYIMRPLLGVTGAADFEQAVSYTRDAAEARQAVLSGEAGAAFILNPTPIEAVTDRAIRGEKMPQKSTYFYPKLPSGLVIYHHEISF